MRNISYRNKLYVENNIKNSIVSISLGVSNFLLLNITCGQLNSDTCVYQFVQIFGMIMPAMVTILTWYMLYVNNVRILPKLSVIRFMFDVKLDNIPVNIFKENPIGEFKFKTIKKIHSRPEIEIDLLEEEF
jgi:hypothetical protein